MEVKPESIIVNSCEYTPVYLIPSPSVTQTGSYILASSNQDSPKPVSDNLKRFYENSGSIANGIVTSPKPRILKKPSSGVIGNNLKLASFLLPKSEPSNVNVNVNCVKKESPTVQNVPAANSIIFKPVPQTTAPAVTTNVVTTVTTVPRVEVDRKIVRVGTIPLKTKPQGRVLPKIMPKESTPPTPHLNPSKHTSVQLLKLGETYHSLNQLSEEQMKIVNHALKMFNEDPEKIPSEPAYDPVTNTKFIYKVVSPRDLTVVGKKAFALKPKKSDVIKRPIIKKVERRVVEEGTEPVVTRSGRTVRPRALAGGGEADAPRPKRKVGSVVSCYQCAAEFASLYRLQRHYENYPTHQAKIHSSLFHCLLAIIKSGSSADQASIFLQQLEQLIDKLKALLPCLLKEMNGEAKQCYINDDIGRMFGLEPGKYNLNMEALSCVKDNSGHCAHNPLPPCSPPPAPPAARVRPLDAWPALTARVWKTRQRGGKRGRGGDDQHIEPGVEDTIVEREPDPVDANDEPVEIERNEKLTTAPVRFHSTHFDIRSSPIKSTSPLIKKFQINPKTLPNFEVQIMRPLTPEHGETSDIAMQTDSDSLQLFRDNLGKDSVLNVDLNFENSKDWPLTDSTVGQHSFILPSLTPIKDANVIEPSLIHKVNEPEDFFRCTKSDSLLTPTHIEAKSPLIEPLLHINGKTNHIFESKQNSTIDSNLIETDKIIEDTLQDKPNGLYQSKPDLLEQGFTQEKADSFLQTFLLGNKSNGLFDESPIRVKSESSLVDPSYMQRDKTNMFDALAHVKQRSHSLFGTTQDKDSLIGRSVLNKGETSFLDIHSNCDSLIDMPKTNMMESSLDKCDNMDSTESNQGNSVLNFLESLGNELAYPETDIRNSSVDFQLDLFTFNSS